MNQPYVTTLVEDAPPGSEVYTITTYDPDRRDNGRVTYAILDGDPDQQFKVVFVKNWGGTRVY